MGFMVYIIYSIFFIINLSSCIRLTPLRVTLCDSQSVSEVVYPSFWAIIFQILAPCSNCGMTKFYFSFIFALLSFHRTQWGMESLTANYLGRDASHYSLTLIMWHDIISPNLFNLLIYRWFFPLLPSPYLRGTIPKGRFQSITAGIPLHTYTLASCSNCGMTKFYISLLFNPATRSFPPSHIGKEWDFRRHSHAKHSFALWIPITIQPAEHQPEPPKQGYPTASCLYE